MNWPWVSRAKLDRALQASVDANSRALLAEAKVDAMQDTLRGWAARYDQLLARYHDMKMAGGAVPAVIKPKERDELISMLHTLPKDRGVRANALRQIEADRAAGLSDVEIMRRMQEGTPADEENGVPE